MTDTMAALDRALTAGGDALMARLGRVEIEHKGPMDLVTDADRASEAAVLGVIREAFPDHDILAEEGGATAGAGGGATGPGDDGWLWIVDPLDGTTNFAHGFPAFSVSIALRRGPRQIVAAGVLAPATGERFLAERGAGATLNGRPLAVSRVADLSGALAVSGFPYDRALDPDRYLAPWRGFLKKAHGVLRLGSAALDLCHVAAGRLDVFWEEKLKPWDTAAGWLIAEEAGAMVTDFSGQPFDPFGPELLATNGLIHRECMETLAESRGGTRR